MIQLILCQCNYSYSHLIVRQIQKQRTNDHYFMTGIMSNITKKDINCSKECGETSNNEFNDLI